MTALQADVAAVKELSDICAKIKRLNDGGFPTKNTETNLYYAAYNAGPAIERLLGIVDKAAAILHHGDHLDKCEGRFTFHSFDGDATRTSKYPTGVCRNCGDPEDHMNHVLSNKPCTCGLDELKVLLDREK